MAGYNKVILLGRLTKDPELRFTPQGSSVCTFGLASSRTYKGNDGTQKEEVCFVDIDTWGRQAETCAEYLKKGREVLVEGRLTLSRWETQDGQKRSKLKVTADRVVFLGGRDAPQTTEEVPPPAESTEISEGEGNETGSN